MRLQEEENELVVRLARLNLMLVIALTTVVFVGIVVLETKPLETSFKGVLICAVTCGSITLLVASLMFVSTGGAARHYSFLSVLSLMLYITALIAVYSACGLVFLAATLDSAPPSSFPSNMTLFKVNASLYAAGTLMGLIATLQLPGISSFLQEFRNHARSNKRFLQFIMTPKDVAQITLMVFVVSALSIFPDVLLIGNKELAGGYRVMFIFNVAMCMLSIFVSFITLISVPASAIIKLTFLMIFNVMSMMTGLFASGWALGVSTRQTDKAWKLRGSSTTTLLVLAGVASFTQLVLVFFIVRGKESLVVLRRQNSLPNIPLSTHLCGDYDALIDATSDEEEYESDAEFGRSGEKRKPSFNNKRKQYVESISESSDEDNNLLDNI